MSRLRNGVNSNRVASNIQFDYFLWMVDLVCNKKYTDGLSWKKLLKFLDSVEFAYFMEMDGNRAKDGEQLRYRFGTENDIPISVIRYELDNRNCSVLEMMVALAVRCEEHITTDPDYGDQTGKWFFEMIESIGLGGMDDRTFDEAYAERCVDDFLSRKYRYDGRGGLFTVPNSTKNMRTLDIWYQMMEFLNNVEYERK